MNIQEQLRLKNLYKACKDTGMNSNLISAYGASVIFSFIGIVYNYFQQATSPIDEGWLLVAERLGIPFVLLVALLVSLWKLVKGITPFLIKQLEKIISLPMEQLSLERTERKEQQAMIEKQQQLLVDVINSINKLTDKIDVFINIYSRDAKKRDDN